MYNLNNIFYDQTKSIRACNLQQEILTATKKNFWQKYLYMYVHAFQNHANPFLSDRYQFFKTNSCVTN